MSIILAVEQRDWLIPVLQNYVNKSDSLSEFPVWRTWEKRRSLLRMTNEECEQSSRQSPHLEWGSSGWEGRFSTTTCCSIDDEFTSAVGWWDEQTMVSYGDDDILFSVFQAPHFALDEAHRCCFLNPAVACHLNLIWQGWDIWAKLHIFFFVFLKDSRGQKRMYISV